jgi:hypothetical protein
MEREEEYRQPVWQRRLLFSIVFVFGTIAAVIGWLADLKDIHLAKYAAIGGHVFQVIGLLGSMLTPDRIEGDEVLGEDSEREIFIR